MTDKSDNLFAKPQQQLPFQFDEKVAEVFPDMIKRSVPGYTTIVQHIEKFASRFITDNSNCYDLGCSLGAASLAISNGNLANNVKIIGIDNSIEMLNRCQQHINAFKHKTPIELVHQDITQVTMNCASLVVLNFTLQFIPVEQRSNLLTNIFNSLNHQGALILSEKVSFKQPEVNNLIIDLHHEFKKENGYSDLEISQKRNALENILIPESLNEHIERLLSIGFSSATCWFQQFNFVSIIAIK
ncbi:carboxy-S-adenosyl-L-methionine synthase CmoA [Aliikangiella maris]|uniref:Carboxy-S-adenosyl-L-methionine synthase n=2 Tax=Aliikangiella maris TaxID=3162458 RepID=A0ABV3MK78_9GAMM